MQVVMLCMGQHVDTAMLLNYELRVYYQLMHAHVARIYQLRSGWIENNGNTLELPDEVS